MKNLSDRLVIKNLTKRYTGSAKPALNKISLTVRSGEVYGFLGPNGAGKSTTIKLLMDFIRPTAGSASILGMDTIKDNVEIKKQIGYLSGDIAMYSDMTGQQFLTYMRQLQPVSSETYLKSLLSRLNVDTTKKLSQLSRGNRQKVAIVQAFMHQPKVLILDEPTSGLDPLMQEVFYELVAEAKARGAIVFMSSHIMSEVQRTCDRVGIIRAGELVDEFVIADLLDESAQTFEISFVASPPLNELRKVSGLKLVTEHGKTVTVTVRGKLSPLFAVLAQHEVSKVAAHSQDLEDIFINYYKDQGGAS